METCPVSTAFRSVPGSGPSSGFGANQKISRPCGSVAGTIAVNSRVTLNLDSVTVSGGAVVNHGNIVGTTSGGSANGSLELDSSITNSGNITGSGTITRGTSGVLSLYLAGDNSGFTGTYQDQNNANAITRFSANTAGSDFTT